MSKMITPVILAGGLGTRLRSVVADRPKVLAMVGGRPFLAYLLDALERAGFDRVVLSVGYMAESVRATFGSRHKSMRIEYSVEESPVGTAGAVVHALISITTPRILLLNGDSFCHVNLRHFIDSCHDSAMVLAHVTDTSRYGRVMTRDGHVAAFAEKKSTAQEGWINAGVYLLRREWFAELPPGFSISLERECLPRWIESHRIQAYSCDGAFIDIGTPESYAQAEEFFANV
jgi:NDP-sugar pyrophosphorylase family protein